jgi:hypothetical protein
MTYNEDSKRSREQMKRARDHERGKNYKNSYQNQAAILAPYLSIIIIHIN